MEEIRVQATQNFLDYSSGHQHWLSSFLILFDKEEIIFTLSEVETLDWLTINLR